MKKIRWSSLKANQLALNQARFNVSFEDCIIAIEAGNVLDDIPNPSPKYQHQRMLVLKIRGYAFVVPYVESEQGIFLKTVFPAENTPRYI